MPRMEMEAEYLPGIHHQSWAPVDDFFPLYGGSGGTALYKYVLLSDWINGSATVDIYTPRSGVKIESAVLCYDPLTLMDDQVTGDVGWCNEVDSEYIAIQAPCTGTGGSGGGGNNPTINPVTFVPGLSI